MTDIRQGIAVNIDIKLDYYTQQQTYMHMQIINNQKKSDLSKYIGLMVQKTLLHIRLRQPDHVYDILQSLFDILDDKSILGIDKPLLEEIKQTEVENIWTKPALFEYTDEQIWKFNGVIKQAATRLGQ